MEIQWETDLEYEMYYNLVGHFEGGLVVYNLITRCIGIHDRIKGLFLMGTNPVEFYGQNNFEPIEDVENPIDEQMKKINEKYQNSDDFQTI